MAHELHDEALSRLLDRGFPQEACLAALSHSGGDLARAGDLIPSLLSFIVEHERQGFPRQACLLALDRVREHHGPASGVGATAGGESVDRLAVRFLPEATAYLEAHEQVPAGALDRLAQVLERMAHESAELLARIDIERGEVCYLISGMTIQLLALCTRCLCVSARPRSWLGRIGQLVLRRRCFCLARKIPVVSHGCVIVSHYTEHLLRRYNERIEAHVRETTNPRFALDAIRWIA